MRRRFPTRAFVLLLALAGPACLAPAGIRYPGLPTVAEGALHIIVFDVGQADAMLVLYKGKSLLFDCGSPNGDPHRASARIPRRLDAFLGDRHLDYFVISHYHHDHVGSPGRGGRHSQPSGIYSLIERDGVTIGTILDRGFWNVGPPGATEREYHRAVGEWIKEGVVGSRRTVHPGDTIDMGPGLNVRVISASANGVLDRLSSMYPAFVHRAHPNENDYSVGLKFTLGNFEMFGAGDLSGRDVLRQFGPVREIYTDIESHVAGSIGAVEVYDVDHHGSAYSSNPCFVQVLHPEVAIFSTGHNTYGHPAPAVYKRIKKYAHVYITGGADRRSLALVKNDIVGDDVEVVVAPDGSHFWVDGQPYTSLSDAQEAARPDARASCQTGAELTPKSFHRPQRSGPLSGD